MEQNFEKVVQICCSFKNYPNPFTIKRFIHGSFSQYKVKMRLVWWHYNFTLRSQLRCQRWPAIINQSTNTSVQCKDLLSTKGHRGVFFREQRKQVGVTFILMKSFNYVRCWERTWVSWNKEFYSCLQHNQIWRLHSRFFASQKYPLDWLLQQYKYTYNIRIIWKDVSPDKTKLL